MMRNGLWLLMLVAMGAWAQGTPALPRYRHDHVNVYPVAGATFDKAVAIDGDVAEWRRESFVQMTAGPGDARAQTLFIAFAYDDAGLYYAVRALDPRPLLNHIDPAQNATEGWRGCSLQLRIVTDPTVTRQTARGVAYTNKTIHATIWQYQRTATPCLDLRYAMYFAPIKTLTGDDAHLRYRRTLRGYSLEGLLPWKVLGVPPMPAGAQTLFTVQPHWADEAGGDGVTFYDVITRDDAQAPFQNIGVWGSALFVKPDDVAATFAAQAAEERRLYAPDPPSTQGMIPLKYALPAAGPATLGVFKPSGALVRNVFADAPRLAGPQMAYWDGLDEAGKAVPDGTYVLKLLTHGQLTVSPVAALGGLPGVPVGVASDAAGRTFILRDGHYHRGGTLQALDAAGTELWRLPLPADVRGTPTAVAAAGGAVYALFDCTTEEGDDRQLLHIIGFDARTGVRLDVRDRPDNWLYAAAREKSYAAANAVALAASDDRLFCALALDNQVIVLDRATGLKLAAWTVARPRALAWDAAGKTLYAVSANRIVALIPDGAVKPVAIGLADPHGVAVNGGTVWTCAGGQVCGFTTNGVPVRAIGTVGGRPAVGAYAPDGVLFPAAMSADAAGRLWVAEADPLLPRVSTWRTDGTLAAERFGPPLAPASCVPDTDDPGTVYRGAVRWAVDAKGARPAAILYRPPADDVPTLRGSAFTLTTVQGQRVAYDGQGGLYRVQGDHLVPTAYVGPPPMGWPFPTADAPERSLLLWHDADGDGRVQAAETRAVPRVFNDGIALPPFPGGALLGDHRLFTPNETLALPDPDDAPALFPKFSPITRIRAWQSLIPAPDGGGFLIGKREGDAQPALYRYTPEGKIAWCAGLDGVWPTLAGAVADSALPGGGAVAVTRDGGAALFAGNGMLLGRVGGDPLAGTGLSLDGVGAVAKVGEGYRLYAADGVWALEGVRAALQDAGTVRVTPEQYQARLMAKPAAPAYTPPVLYLPRATPTLDGTLRGWDPTCVARFGPDDAVAAQLAYDNAHLYVAFTVADASPWCAAGTDWRVPFLSGDALAVHLTGPLGRDPRDEAFPYTVHLFLSPDGADGVRGQACFPIAPPGVTGITVPFRDSRPYRFTAVPLPRLRAHVTRTASGYTVEAAVPWAALGLEASPQLRAELGIYYSDATGRATCAAQSTTAPRPRRITGVDSALQEAVYKAAEGWRVVEVERDEK
jgi:hypothetical protein